MRPTETTLNDNSRSSLTGLPLKLVDLGILSVVFLAPLFMGGRGHVGKFVFVSIVCATVVAWAIAQCRQAKGQWRWSGVEWMLLASIILVILQLTPLPPSLLGHASPSIGKLLPLWQASGSATGQLGEWSTVSVAPEATRGALIILLGYIMLFLLIVQRIQSIEDVARILRWLAIGTIAMAVLGLVQFLAGNGKFLWVFEHPSRDTFRVVKGPFQNQNHFAHFLALGVGPLIWAWTRTPAKLLQKHVFGIGLGLVIIAGLLTFSRGGVIAIGVAAAVCIGVFLRNAILGKKSLLAVGAIGLVIGVALCIHGYEPLARRLATLRDSRSLEEVCYGRDALWSALMDGIPSFRVLGSGIGSHREVYPMFMEEYFNIEFTHGESGYLPLLLEAGVPGLVLMLAGIGICFFWCLAIVFGGRVVGDEQRVPGRERGSSSQRTRWQRTRQPAEDLPTSTGFIACAGAILASLVASVVHSVGDFVWYLSACMSLTVILAACACRLYQLRSAACSQGVADPASPVDTRFLTRMRNWRGLQWLGGGTSSVSRPTWIAVTVAVAAIAVLLVRDRSGPALAAPHWHAFLRTAHASESELAPNEDLERDYLLTMTKHLEQTLRFYPHDPRANIRFAGVCLRRFELEQRHAQNPMALSQIRDAAFASQFPSRDAQQTWLEAAIGENQQLLHQALRHTRRGLQGCPLQGEGYVYLADLSFLLGPREAAKHAYIAQGRQVRPHSGVLLFAIGQEAVLVDDLPTAMRYWKEAFNHDPKIRVLIIETLAGRVPADFLLNNFDPQIDGLSRLYNHYRKVRRKEDARVVAVRYVEALHRNLQQTEATEQLVAGWCRAQEVHVFLEDYERALACGQQVVGLEPNNFKNRQKLADLLVRHGRFAEAVEQYQWCLRRKPGDQGLSRQLTEAKRSSLSMAASAGLPEHQKPRR